MIYLPPSAAFAVSGRFDLAVQEEHPEGLKKIDPWDRLKSPRPRRKQAYLNIRTPRLTARGFIFLALSPSATHPSGARHRLEFGVIVTDQHLVQQHFCETLAGARFICRLRCFYESYFWYQLRLAGRSHHPIEQVD